MLLGVVAEIVDLGRKEARIHSHDSHELENCIFVLAQSKYLESSLCPQNQILTREPHFQQKKALLNVWKNEQVEINVTSPLESGASTTKINTLIVFSYLKNTGTC